MATSSPVVIGVVLDLGAQSGANWKWRNVDRDDIDELPGKLGVSIDLDFQDSPPLRIKTLEDFRPESIASGSPDLAKLLAAREAAGDLVRFRKLADESGAGREIEAALSLSQDRSSPPLPPPVEPKEVDAETARDVLESILEGGAGESRREDPAQRLIREIADSIPRCPDRASVDRIRCAVDSILGKRLREIFGNPRFRRREAAWRSLNLLVKEAETGPELRIAVLPVPEEELLADLRGGALRLEEVTETAWDPEFRGAVPAVLFLDLEFGPQKDDVQALAGLARIESLAGAPRIAAARSQLAGAGDAGGLTELRDLAAASADPELEEFWKFRESPLSSRIGLCLPRLLLRLPYGPSTNPVEGFEFQEVTGAGESGEYLWGNPALALARLAARAFSSGACNDGLLARLELKGLPFHTFRDGEEVRSKSPMEVELPVEAVTELAARGLIPLLSFRGRDAARFPAIQSVAGTALF